MKIAQKTVSVRGLPIIVKMVVCTPRERQKLEGRGDKAIRASVDLRALHRDGDGEMFICFIDVSAAPVVCFAAVHESDRSDSPTLCWSQEEQAAAIREALALFTSDDLTPG